MTIYSIKAERTMAEPGILAFDAEARVLTDERGELYVSVNRFDGDTHYGVSDISFIDGGCEEPKYLKEYESTDEAGRSPYGEVFHKLESIVGMLEDEK